MIEYHKRPFTLKELKIEVTYRCDLNCVHCSSDARPSNALEMSREDCIRILQEAAEMGAREVAFSGGEPLIWPHIVDAVQAAASNRFATGIYTSGNTDDFEDQAVRLRRLGASRFIFSLFGATTSTHERITRKAGSFARTIKAMLLARKAQLETEVHFVPMSNNYRELKDIALLARDHGASTVSVLRLVPQGRAVLLSGRVLNKVQNLELRRQIRALRAGGQTIRTGSPYNFLMLSNHPKCSAAVDRLIVGPDLRIYPCDAFKKVRAEELTGTLDWSSLQTQSLRGCWDKSPFLEAIRTYLTTPFAEPCESCGILGKCLSGCLAQKVIANGNLEKRPDPDCLGPDFKGDDQ
jgi:radical SAM protein with 4Fe4S-binding SPASM domain